MKISGYAAVAILAGQGSAFRFAPSFADAPRARTRTENSAISSDRSRANIRRRSSLHIGQSCSEPEDSAQLQQNGFEQQVTTSRRDALRRCSSFFSATVCASIGNRRKAHASEFSESPQPGVIVDQPPIRSTGPQFYDESVVTPPRPQAVPVEPGSIAPPSESSVASKEASAAAASARTTPSAVVTLDNSVTPAKTTEGSNNGGMFIAQLAASAAVLSATISAVAGRVEPNTDELTAKCKVVMIENEPYGLNTGRQWYNGVDVTINNSIPASDVREYCEAGKLNYRCTETIAGFLGDISSNKQLNVGEPSVEQQETATEVLSYLDSLSNGGSSTSETATAFTSYLNGLSNGEVDAPASPELVDDYLNSVSEDGQQRLDTVENRISNLESSVNKLPDEISTRLLQWQEGQDERLANELAKIENILVNTNKSNYSSMPQINGVNGEGSQQKIPFS